MKKNIIDRIISNKLLLTTFDRPEGWVLESGAHTEYYFNLRTLSSSPSLIRDISNEIGEMIHELVMSGEMNRPNRILGVLYGGILLATMVMNFTDIPMVYAKKALKYGHHSLIEGIIRDGDNILIVEDVTVALNSVMNTINMIEHDMNNRSTGNISTVYVITLIDREEGALENVWMNRLRLHPYLTLSDFKQHIDKMSKVQV